VAPTKNEARVSQSPGREKLFIRNLDGESAQERASRTFRALTAVRAREAIRDALEAASVHLSRTLILTYAVVRSIARHGETPTTSFVDFYRPQNYFCKIARIAVSSYNVLHVSLYLDLLTETLIPPTARCRQRPSNPSS
jgi:hypothetical protein